MRRADLQYLERYHSRLALAGFWTVSLLHQLVRVIGCSFLYMVGVPDRSQTAFKVRPALPASAGWQVQCCHKMSSPTQPGDQGRTPAQGTAMRIKRASAVRHCMNAARQQRAVEGLVAVVSGCPNQIVGDCLAAH